MECTGQQAGSQPNTTIREAIRKLELEGALMIPRKGAEVARIAEDLRDVLEVRTSL